MMTALTLLLGSAAFIYFACEFFINGVEWLGRKLNVSQTATGSILAALGTALPESVVTFVAVAFGDSVSQKDIGIGAAFGGPLVLSTLAYAVVGMTLLHYLPKSRHAPCPLVAMNTHALQRDQRWFMVLFMCKLALGLVIFSFKPWLGLFFLAAYGFYSWKTLNCPPEEDELDTLEPLKLQPHDTNPSLLWSFIQTLAALGIIFVASQVFVNQIEVLGEWIGLDPQFAALLFSPFATELPEIMNAIIWVRQGKARMALANISGSMMIQTTIPTALGLFFTPWLIKQPSLMAAGFTIMAILFLQWLFRSRNASAARLAYVGGLYGLCMLCIAGMA